MITQIWCGDNYPESIIGARVITIPVSDTPTIAADYKRLQLACDEPDLIYADFDIEPWEGFFEYFENLEKGKPHFAFYGPPNSPQYPEACLFAVNGCCDFFKGLLEDKIKRNIVDCYSWTFKVLRTQVQNVFRIPDDIYYHRHDTMFKPKK